MSPQPFPQQLMTIALCALATVLTRALPFMLFPASRPAPKWVTYLGQVLPAAVFGLLVVYCLRNVDVRHSGGDCHRRDGAAAHLASADALVYCRRHDCVYAAGADDVIAVTGKAHYFAGAFASAEATRGLSDRPLDPFGLHTHVS